MPFFYILVHMSSAEMTQSRPPFWRDERILGWLWQILVLLLVIGLGTFLFNNMVSELQTQRNIVFSYRWIGQVSGFDISESLISYDSTATYGRAIVVGILNTLKVAVVAIAASSIMGLFWGIVSISPNFLARRIAIIYVEVFRNVPLLVLLYFWYSGLFLTLPRLADAHEFPGPTFLSIRGLYIPWGTPTSSWASYVLILVLGLVCFGACFAFLRWRETETGRSYVKSLWGMGVFLLIAAVGWIALPAPLTLSLPAKEGLRIVGGYSFSPEFISVVTALSVYASAYVAEIVRGGILAVHHGQQEASSALGLTRLQSLRLVILPQAMRVIVPPLISQFLNLTKNTTLAVAIGYPDFFHTTAKTTLNQTGREIEVFLLVMLVYLTLSLVTSVILNWYNSHFQIKER